jgi:hypothetical protein
MPLLPSPPTTANILPFRARGRSITPRREGATLAAIVSTVGAICAILALGAAALFSGSIVTNRNIIRASATGLTSMHETEPSLPRVSPMDLMIQNARSLPVEDWSNPFY